MLSTTFHPHSWTPIAVILYKINMTKLSTVLLLLCVVATQSQASTLTWCAYYNWNPWIYPVDTGYAGILIDQLNLFKINNPEIKVEARIIENWKRCQVEVETGKVTMILGANKTPERELIFDYLDMPAFINKNSVSAYSSVDNDRMNNLKSLDELSHYHLALVRGDTFGGRIDDHIQSLPDTHISLTNSHIQSLRMVKSKRVDYVLLQQGLLRPLITEHSIDDPELNPSDFKKLLTVTRETPAYYAFGKGTDGLTLYSEAWKKTLKQYFSSVDIDTEIIRHKKQKQRPK